ncbi:LnmK family bifunctional acyltransferase/decarboxylase [Nocardia tengchongensis]|uniref:LnmK family bifunctional acyltransferase/decarboxylase n=1 Tax=Nocardia tengchongensis TaxID=2055889 RepID=UPI0033FA8083
MSAPSAGTVPALGRRVRVTPSMCGHSPALYARIGDWTWDTVSELCDVDVLSASDADGDPTYLSFFYFRVRGSTDMHPHGLTFGDQLAVASAAFDFGSESVLTLHRIAPGHHGAAETLDLDEFYQNRRSDCLYVETMNRWIGRTVEGSNQNLKLASPPGFRHTALPRLPAQHSPRAACANARKHGSFHTAAAPGYRLVVPDLTGTHQVDLTRDLNGVGLLYFASFFAYVDSGVLDLWRALGRDDSAFLTRKVTDVRICYFGNTDADQGLEVTSRLWAGADPTLDELAEVVIRERSTARVLAVAEVRLSGQGAAR